MVSMHRFINEAPELYQDPALVQESTPPERPPVSTPQSASQCPHLQSALQCSWLLYQSAAWI